jgi:hypothetical protein
MNLIQKLIDKVNGVSRDNDGEEACYYSARKSPYPFVFIAPHLSADTNGCFKLKIAKVVGESGHFLCFPSDQIDSYLFAYVSESPYNFQFELGGGDFPCDNCNFSSTALSSADYHLRLSNDHLQLNKKNNKSVNVEMILPSEWDVQFKVKDKICIETGIKKIIINADGIALRLPQGYVATDDVVLESISAYEFETIDEASWFSGSEESSFDGEFVTLQDEDSLVPQPHDKASDGYWKP